MQPFLSHASHTATTATKPPRRKREVCRPPRQQVVAIGSLAYIRPVHRATIPRDPRASIAVVANEGSTAAAFAAVGMGSMQ